MGEFRENLNLSLEELLYWSKLLLDKHGNPDPSVENANLVSTKEQRLGSAEATNNLPKSAQQPSEEESVWLTNNYYFNG